jgi:NIMA (never in mitosis gene a)-related kinase
MFSNIGLEELKKEKVLGEGTFGKCYLVEHRRTDLKCVLKQIEIFGMSEEEQLEVVKEAKILSVLDHPNIIKFYSSFKTETHINIVMEHADGGDLSRLIREAKGVHFPEQQILNWFSQICLAIQHIHSKKVIHRDLKSQNIFMTKAGAIKLGDFGIAKHLSRTVEKMKTVVGTPYYMSPEICESRDYSFKTDIWSLGVILYEMCELRLPFEGNSLPVLALKISKGEYAALTANYSKELKVLVKTLLQNNPNKRPSICRVIQNPIIAKCINQQFTCNFVKELVDCDWAKPAEK